MRIIVGLGNPGTRYRCTKHNVGFRCIDLLARRWGIRLSERRAKAVLGRGRHLDEDIVLAKPRTFMNHSGEGVEYLVSRFGVKPTELVIVYDDIHLPVGRLRMRPRGAARVLAANFPKPATVTVSSSASASAMVEVRAPSAAATSAFESDERAATRAHSSDRVMGPLHTSARRDVQRSAGGCRAASPRRSQRHERRENRSVGKPVENAVLGAQWTRQSAGRRCASLDSISGEAAERLDGVARRRPASIACRRGDAEAAGAVPGHADREPDAEDGRGHRAALKASVFAPLAETQQKSSRFSPRLGKRHPRPRLYIPVSRRRLPVQAGFTACRPRMNVPATGIIHAGPGSLMRTGGEG